MPKLSSRFIPFGVWGALLMSANAASAAADQAPSQELLPLSVRVVDPEGQPVAGVKIIPWALRSSQGHGTWSKDGQGESEPSEFSTDADGRAEIEYPRYSYADERVRVLSVTLSIDHPDFAYISHENIDVPLQEAGPHVVKLARGAMVEILPIQEGMPADLHGLYLKWSDSRSWKPGVTPVLTDSGSLRIPTMAAGRGEVMAVRLEGDQATHFSRIVPLDVHVGEQRSETLELHPAARIMGKLSDNVPRPVKNGRVSARTVPLQWDGEHVQWISWTPIAEDGTFVFDAWPASEDAQIIALCDGFIAESGAAPAVAKQPPERDRFSRPQVFTPAGFAQPIELQMTALVNCEVEAVDRQGKAVAGAKIVSCPNVGWWNVGSQIYCTPLVRGERLLRERKFEAAVERDAPIPFIAVTDAAGRATLDLPVGKEDLYVESDDYELPVNVGRREQEVELVAGEITHVR
ncbi:MAG: Ig-like domain-containing protein, partial [Pirellulales bacterium]